MPATQEINQVGKRQELADIVAVADRKGTPFTSMVSKGKKPVNTLYEWQAGKVPEADTDGVIDGKDADTTQDGSGARAVLQGRVQKLWKLPMVSDLAEDNDVAGIESEFANSKANMTKALKRSIEAVFCSDNESQKDTGAQPYKTRGLGKWIQAGAHGDLPVDANYRTPAAQIFSGSLASMKEDDVRAIMQALYNVIGESLDLDCLAGTDLVSAFEKMTIYLDNVSNKTIVRTFFQNLDPEKAVLSRSIDIIKGSFGQMRIHPTVWNGFNNTTKQPDTKRGYILNMKGIQMVAKRLPGFKPLPDLGGGPRGIIDAIIGLKVFNPLEHGAIKAS